MSLPKNGEEWRKLALKKNYQHVEGFLDDAKNITFDLDAESDEILENAAEDLVALSDVSYQIAVETIIEELIRRACSDPAFLDKLIKIKAERDAKKQRGDL